MTGDTILHLAKRLEEGYIYDERYYDELLKLIQEKAGDNFATIVQYIIEALQEQNHCDIIVTL